MTGPEKSALVNILRLGFPEARAQEVASGIERLELSARAEAICECYQAAIEAAESADDYAKGAVLRLVAEFRAKTQEALLACGAAKGTR